MDYTKEIRRKANVFTDALENGNITISMIAKVDYMSHEDCVILFNMLEDFYTELRISEKFKRWLLNKSILQAEVFE